MFQSLADDLKAQFRYGNALTRLIIVNVIVFIAINIFFLLATHLNAGQTAPIYRKVVHWLSISSDWVEFLLRPWTWLTSMFLHEGFWHILWNMLFLYWFGRIFGDLAGDKRVFPLYLMAGFTGAIAFLLSANFLNYGGGGTMYALGASGAVMGLVLASGALAPDYIMNLILIGPVKLKYIVAALLFLDLIGTAGNINTGGHFAHLGGALFGWYYVYMLKRGTDLAEPIIKFFNYFRERNTVFGQSETGKSPLKTIYKSRQSEKMKKRERSPDFQDELDRILEKIKQSGYDSLTDEEKEFLFQASKK